MVTLVVEVVLGVGALVVLAEVVGAGIGMTVMVPLIVTAA